MSRWQARISEPHAREEIAMNSPLRILMLEDNPADAELILATLEKNGIRCDVVRVETQADFLGALERSSFDLILSDCSLPAFDGFSALKITREIDTIRAGSGAKSPQTPFIFVSGTIGEELAIDTLKRGATDYVLKQRLSRLVPAVRRAIAEAEEQAARLDAQRSHLKAESLFRGLFDHVAAGVVIADLENRIIKSNGALQAMLGYSEAELFGMPLARLTYPEDTAADLPAHEELCAGKRRSYQIDKRYLRREGAILWGRVTVSLLQTQDDSSCYSIILIEDVTDRRRAEQQIRNLSRLENAAAESEAANRAKSVFLSTMSHEIRTPMNAILGYSQLMLRDPGLGIDAKANLKIINRSGEHLLALINDVLDMSKIEAGRAELNPTTFSLSGLLDDLGGMFRLRAEAKALRFEVLVDGESVPYVVADQGKIRQALINLLGNAIKFTERGYIRLHVTLDQRRANRLWFSARVEDTGSCITDDEQKKLFQPFSQTKRGLSTQEGTGLGLAISRACARLMGGDLTVTSSPGTGSIFQFEVPIERGDAKVAIRPSAPRRVIGIRAGQEVLRILVADDLLENRDWLVKLLRVLGFSVQGVENGEAAIRSWEEWNPGLILMDVHMPVMDGLEATRRIKATPRGKETVIIALTASAMDDQRLTALQSGVDDFITKPCDEYELLEKMRVHLNIAYDYEEMNGNESEPAAGASALSAERLGKVPLELVEQLRNATLSGNKNLMDNLILKVGTTGHAGSAQALQKLADHYEYDALIQLLEK